MSYIVGFGEIMLRLSSLQNERLLQSAMFNATFGGVEANVCVSSSIFGLKSRYISAFPNNVIGHKAEEILLSHRVDTSAIAWTGERMGLYFVDAGSNQRVSSVTYDRAHSSISEAKVSDFDWDRVFDDAGIFHITGITPGISDSARELTLYALKEAKKRNVKVSCDINYRKKLWKYGKNICDIMPEIVRYADILFANEYDVIKILGIKSLLDCDSPASDEDYISLMNDTIKEYSLETIITTRREVISSSHNNFSSEIYTKGSLYHSKKYYITNIVDRVGTGDAFAAGILSGMHFFDSTKEILEFATAAACLKHSIYGDLNLSTKEEVMELMKSGASLDVKR